MRITLTVSEQPGTQVAVWCDLTGMATANEREIVQKLGAAINAQMREWSHPGFTFMEQRRAQG